MNTKETEAQPDSDATSGRVLRFVRWVVGCADRPTNCPGTGARVFTIEHDPYAFVPIWVKLHEKQESITPLHCGDPLNEKERKLYDALTKKYTSMNE